MTGRTTSPSSASGMHPWGKWGRNFVEYGVAAARGRARRRRPRLDRRAVRVRRRHDAQRLPRLRRRARPSPRRSAGPARRWRRRYAACASGATALDAARARILAGLCDVALVVGADTTPKGFLAPNAGDRPDDPDWLRFRLLGATNPTYFALYARRRMDLYGATDARLRRGQGQERPARPRQPQRPVPQGGHRRGGARLADRGRPAAPARHLRHVRRRRRGRLSLAWSTPAGHGVDRPGARSRRLHGHADASPTPSSTCPTSPPTPRAVVALRRARRSATRSRHAAYEEAGIGPDDLDLAEVYDLSTALELDWYENIGLCKAGEAERLLRRRRHHDRRPHPGQPERRAGLLRRGRARPGASPRCARSPGSCGARPPAARSRAPRSASPPTRACSATAPRSCSSADPPAPQFVSLSGC